MQNCPLDGRCLQESVVYSSKVVSDVGTREYIGVAKNAFKKILQKYLIFKYLRARKLTNRRHKLCNKCRHLNGFLLTNHSFLKKYFLGVKIICCQKIFWMLFSQIIFFIGLRIVCKSTSILLFCCL